MGALHEGHASLLRVARDRVADGPVVVSIFVNPLQFGAGRGPRPLPPHARRRTSKVCEREGVDVVFAPAVDEVYPGGEPQVTVEPGPLADVLEGTDPARPLPRRADGGRQAVRPGPARRRRLRREGLPAARAGPADGRRPLPAASRSSAPRPCASPTAWRCPAATATSTPSSGSRRPRSTATLRAAQAAAGVRRATRRSTPRAPSCAPPRGRPRLPRDHRPRPRRPARPTYPAGTEAPDPRRRPGRQHPPDRQPAARPRARPRQRRQLMLRTMMKSKIHRATVTQADLHYVGR